jgi:NTE family protein
MVTRLFSPYQLNPLDYNPVLEIIEELIDFEAIRRHDELKLFVTATNVRTGKPRVFTTSEMTAQVLMASACLPQMFKAVEIDGEHYWDGGYMGNPAIYPMFTGLASSDVILVHINPLTRNDVPTTAADIMNRLNEISFNSTLMREMRAVKVIQDIQELDWIKDEHKHKLRSIYMHSIRDDATMAKLPVASKGKTDWKFLTGLRDKGRATAQQWLAENFDAVGQRSTINLEREFF